jgi:hypothetical protein
VTEDCCSLLSCSASLPAVSNALNTSRTSKLGTVSLRALVRPLPHRRALRCTDKADRGLSAAHSPSLPPPTVEEKPARTPSAATSCPLPRRNSRCPLLRTSTSPLPSLHNSRTTLDRRIRTRASSSLPRPPFPLLFPSPPRPARTTRRIRQRLSSLLPLIHALESLQAPPATLSLSPFVPPPPHLSTRSNPSSLLLPLLPPLVPPLRHREHPHTPTTTSPRTLSLPS